MSATARAMRPLPSSNGWIVTNHRCAVAAFRTSSIWDGDSNQSMNAAISPSMDAAGGASKCTRSRPTAPDTTRIGPRLSVRHPPTSIRLNGLPPIENSASCQPKRRSAVSGASQRWAASSVMSTMPSTSRPTLTAPPTSMPRRRATLDRVCAASSVSPSIAPLLTASAVSVSATACRLRSNPMDDMRPARSPCRYLASASALDTASESQRNLGQSGCCHMYILRGICVDCTP